MKTPQDNPPKKRNPVSQSPILKKGHAHKSAKDYDRSKEKVKLKKEQLQDV